MNEEGARKLWPGDFVMRLFIISSLIWIEVREQH